MADWGKKRDGSALGFTYMNYSGTQIALVAEVTLDRRTGTLRVPRVWTALDPGIAVQPDNIVAQTESSIVYGLGFALYERITVDDGAVQESNFYDYHVPRMNEIPEMFIEVVPTNNHPTGVGQMATPLGRARDRQRGRRTHRRAAARHADDARAREAGAGLSELRVER